ncbi:hypothetical protein [Polyangium sp. y55x31]|uniref:hypothetical protein n=1 Tax=Polyangium sp. y55x31 TaxID=3042688 RepID=UPI002482C3DA|nr:hypothetical protein [Polyangium sp. y55x31]MDI1477283.1 hypothetical protein [Polyangium sp. y55x31]
MKPRRGDVPSPAEIVFSIMERRDTGGREGQKGKKNADFREVFREDVEAWEHLALRPDGSIVQTQQMNRKPFGSIFSLVSFEPVEEIVGTYRILDPDEARRTWKAATWFDVEYPCPWVGEVLGYCGVTLAPTAQATRDAPPSIDRTFFLSPFVHAARGILARPEGEWRHLVIEYHYGVENIASKYGFSDGDLFLTRDYGSYLQAIIDDANEKIRAAGAEGEVYFCGTSHNPVRLGDELKKDGEPVDVWQLFGDDDEISFWGYDWDALKDPRFL